jgi:hypothetical protein
MVRKSLEESRQENKEEVSSKLTAMAQDQEGIIWVHLQCNSSDGKEIPKESTNKVTDNRWSGVLREVTGKVTSDRWSGAH